MRIDGSKVRLFGSRSHAEDGARAIGWPVGAVSPVETRFQSCWAIGTGIATDPYTDLPWLSRERYAELYYDRKGAPPSAPAMRRGEGTEGKP